MSKYLFSLFIVLFISTISKAQTFTYSNLPIIIIDTDNKEILDDPKIIAHMGIIWNENGQNNYLTNEFNHYDGYIGIEIRGSTSQQFPKKQYSIELWDSEGDDIEEELLGMPSEGDWILSAPYNDKTLMRDMLAYDLGESLGHYSPRARYCELVLNGVYQGVYMLREKIKRNKNRVNITKMNPDKISGTAVTGGYLIKIDKTNIGEPIGFTSDYLPVNNLTGQNINFLFEYPKPEDIAEEQKAYIKKYVHDFETSLTSDDFKELQSGYRQYIDVGSFIDFFIVTELTKNIDGYRLSTFLHKQNDANGGKLRIGPIWDFNLGFGNANTCTDGNTEGWVFKFNQVCGEDAHLVPFWWERFMDDPLFLSELKTRWTTLREKQLSETTIFNTIDSVHTLLNNGAQQRNFERWPVLGEYVWPNYYIGTTYNEEVDWLKFWISNRLIWMDNAIVSLKSKNGTTSVINQNSPEQQLLYPNPGSQTISLLIKDSIEWVKIISMDGQVELYSTSSFTTKFKGLVVIEVKTSEGIQRQRAVIY